MFKSNQIRYVVYLVYLESTTKRFYAVACLGKSKLFVRKFAKISSKLLFLNFKTRSFSSGEGVFKSNPTWYGVYPVYFECTTKRSYASLSRKKLGFHTETCEFRDQRIFKTGHFHRMKELFKPNQTQYVWSNPCLPRVWNKNCYCWPGKKWVFLTEICCYFEFLVFKYSIFHRVKKLSKSNKTWYGLCHVYLERRTKKIAIGCPGKKLVIHTENLEYFEKIPIIEF